MACIKVKINGQWVKVPSLVYVSNSGVITESSTSVSGVLDNNSVNTVKD